MDQADGENLMTESASRPDHDQSATAPSAATGEMPTQNNSPRRPGAARGRGRAPARRRESATTDGAYHRWPQWIFLRICNGWLAPDPERARPRGDLAAELEPRQREPVSDANP